MVGFSCYFYDLAQLSNMNNWLLFTFGFIQVGPRFVTVFHTCWNHNDFSSIGKFKLKIIKHNRKEHKKSLYIKLLGVHTFKNDEIYDIKRQLIDETLDPKIGILICSYVKYFFISFHYLIYTKNVSESTYFSSILSINLINCKWQKICRSCDWVTLKY